MLDDATAPEVIKRCRAFKYKRFGIQSLKM